MIREEKKREICGLYEEDISTHEISTRTKVSEPTICKILKDGGFPKCRRCGMSLSGKRLSTRYCDACRNIVATDAVMKTYKMRRALQLPINKDGDLINLSVGEISTHGDIYGINITGSLGTSNLGASYRNKEDEYNAIMREHKRIFGGEMDDERKSFC